MHDLAWDDLQGHWVPFICTTARATSAATYRRVDMPRREQPLQGAAIGDARLPEADRLGLSTYVADDPLIAAVAAL